MKLEIFSTIAAKTAVRKTRAKLNFKKAIKNGRYTTTFMQILFVFVAFVSQRFQCAKRRYGFYSDLPHNVWGHRDSDLLRERALTTTTNNSIIFTHAAESEERTHANEIGGSSLPEGNWMGPLIVEKKSKLLRADDAYFVGEIYTL